MVGFIRPPCDAGVIEATPAFDSALSRRRKRLTLVATIIGSSMALLDGSVVNIALPAIQRALHADAAATQWIVSAYLLLLGAFVLIGGSATDLYGRRRTFVLGIAVFTAASIACAFSPNIDVLIVSRAVQGLGAALLMPASLAMLGATFDEDERNRAIGIWAGAGALMMAAGPLLGGWLVDQVSWRAIFLLNVPLAIAAAGLALRFGCESSDPHANQLDRSGAATVALGLAAITWGLNEIPASGFRDQTVLAALGAGAAFLMSFVVIEARLNRQAMMPLSLYRSRNFSATNALTLLLYFALGGALYYLPFGLIRLGGYSATQAGAALLPFALTMGFGASLAATIGNRLGPQIGDARFCRSATALLGRCVSADVPAGRRNGNHGPAADVDCDGRRRQSTCRHCFRRQQRGRSNSWPACGCNTRSGVLCKLFTSPSGNDDCAGQRGPQRRDVRTGGH